MSDSQSTIKSTLIITAIQGKAWVRDAKGVQHPAAVGEVLKAGEMLITGPSGKVDLENPDGVPIELGSNRQLLIEADVFGTHAADASEAAIAQLNQNDQGVLQAIQNGQDLNEVLDPTAAGLNAGDGTDGGHGFVRLLRIVESVPPLSFEFGSPDAARRFEFGDTARGDDGTTTTPTDSTATPVASVPPKVTIPDTDGSTNATDMTLSESAAATAGSFTISAQAGIGSITVGGTVLTLAQLNNLGSSSVSINTGEGTLVLTGYNAGTGVVSYSYDPNVQTHSGGTPIVDHISIKVTDANGVSSTDSLDIGITDDAPVAKNDNASITEDASPNTVNGNVLLNNGNGADQGGADGLISNPVSLVGSGTGSYGTLVLNSDGTYTYTLDNSNATVNALNDNSPPLTETFSYTIRDADGSTSTAQLTITINGHTDGAPVITIPDTDGNANATDSTLPESAGPTNGSFTISAQAGIGSITVGGTVLTLAQLNNLGSSSVSINTGEGT
ncbi:retention module-containing protein, partial [Leeia sp.]|uniref:retention module-containing protein n=1 Tax=Leeia sp. TaxID=2884678 RepID=UPI0035AF9FFF